MKIIVDAMAATTRPSPGHGGHPGQQGVRVDITLVGRGEDILKVLKDNGIQDLPAGVEIAHAPRWWRSATTRPPPSGRRRTPPSPWV